MVKTLYGMSVYVRADRAWLEIRAIAGMVAGTARPTEQATWKTPLERNSSSIQPLTGPSGVGGARAAVVALGVAAAGVREPVELEVLVLGARVRRSRR